MEEGRAGAQGKMRAGDFASAALTCRQETVPNMGVLTSAPGRPGAGMEWRVTIELNGADGTRQIHEVARGGGTDPHSPVDPLGLTLDDGKTCWRAYSGTWFRPGLRSTTHCAAIARTAGASAH